MGRPGRVRCSKVFRAMSLGEEGLSRGRGDGQAGSAWAQEVSAEGLADRLSRSSRGRCGVPPSSPVSRTRAAKP